MRKSGGSRIHLSPCPACHMDSGDRKMTDGIPPRYLVICGSCGARTKLSASPSAATRLWQLGDVIEKKGQVSR